jgi:hypothetical protein
MSRYRLDVEKAGVWCPGQVLFPMDTPLRTLYQIAREFQETEAMKGCPVRVVVVHTLKFEQIEIVRVFGDVAEPVTDAVAES